MLCMQLKTMFAFLVPCNITAKPNVQLHWLQV